MNYQNHPEYARAYSEMQSGQPRYEIIGRLISQAGVDSGTANGMLDQIEMQLRGGGQPEQYGGQQGGYADNPQIAELRRQMNSKGTTNLILGILMIIGGIVLTLFLFEAGYVAGISIFVIIYGVIYLIKGISLLSKAGQLR